VHHVGLRGAPPGREGFPRDNRADRLYRRFVQGSVGQRTDRKRDKRNARAPIQPCEATPHCRPTASAPRPPCARETTGTARRRPISSSGRCPGADTLASRSTSRGNQPGTDKNTFADACRRCGGYRPSCCRTRDIANPQIPCRISRKASFRMHQNPSLGTAVRRLRKTFSIGAVRDDDQPATRRGAHQDVCVCAIFNVPK
jgi:hypothetical protein